MVNGRGQLGSFEFHMLEKLNLPQFPYLQNKVIVAPVLFGENSVKTHVRHLAWSLEHRKCAGRIHLGCCAWFWGVFVRRDIDTLEWPLDGGLF